MTTTRERLEAVRRHAGDALQKELRRGRSGGDLARRARDYRSWVLMRDYPTRIEGLARAVCAEDNAGLLPGDAEKSHELCLDLAALLAELCEEAAGLAGGRAEQKPTQSQYQGQ
jgi:hypothetical protein